MQYTEENLCYNLTPLDTNTLFIPFTGVLMILLLDPDIPKILMLDPYWNIVMVWPSYLTNIIYNILPLQDSNYVDHTNVGTEVIHITFIKTLLIPILLQQYQY